MLDKHARDLGVSYETIAHTMGSESHIPVFAQLYCDQASDRWPSQVPPPDTINPLIFWKTVQWSCGLNLLRSIGATMHVFLNQNTD